MTAESTAVALAVHRSRGPVRPAVGRPWWWEFVVGACASTALFLLGFGDWRQLAGPLGTQDLLPAYATGYLWSLGAPFGDTQLGFPFGMELRYYPTADVLQNLAAGVLGSITGSPFAGMNLAYAVSFPATTLAALFVFRVAGLTGPFRLVTALALTFIPYHWFRIDHVYLGTMYSAVLGVGLALLVGSGAVQRALRSRPRPKVVVLGAALAVVIGGSGIYYACFTILLCVVAMLYRAAQGAGPKELLRSAVPVVGVGIALALFLTPSTIFVHAHPPLEPVADRLVVESVVYSGALVLALLPAPISWIPGAGPVNDLVSGALAAADEVPTSGVLWLSNTGSWATLSALVVFGVGGFVLVRRRARTPAAGDLAGPPGSVPVGLVGSLLLAGILFFMPWGLNFLFADLVSPQLRGWDRLVPVLFTLVFVGAGVVVRRLHLRVRPRALQGLVVAALALLLLDGVMPYRAVIAEEAREASVFSASGRAYAAELNSAVPGDCGVLELPYLGYPERPGRGDMGSYDLLWPALTNPDKRWSFGAVAGTLGGAWLERLGDEIQAEDVAPLVAGGFCAVHVDRRGYAPDRVEAVLDGLQDVLGAPVATGLDGNWLAYALPRSGSSSPADVLISAPDGVGTFYAPPEVSPADGADTVQVADAPRTTWSLTGSTTEFVVRSLDGGPAFVSVDGRIQSAGCAAPVLVTLSSAGQAVSRTIQLRADGSQRFTVTLEAGTRSAELTVDSGGDCTSGQVLLVDPHAVG